MLDVNKATINNLEEFYLMLKAVFIVFMIIVEKLLILEKKENSFINKYLIGFYLIYIGIQFVFFIKNMNNNKNLKPNFFIAVLDATFLLVFIYLNSQYLYTLMPILYVYILFQNIRFSKLNPLIFPSIVTIGGIFICKKLFINIFSIENVII